MKNIKKSLVVLSGGQDSTTCLAWAKDNFDSVETITFDYNQRHKLEIEYAKEIADYFNVKNKIINLDLLNQLTSNALTRSDIEVKEGESGSLPNTFVDGRNMLFLTFAAIHAKQNDISNIVTGVCQTDFSGYPDCRDVFIKSLNVTLNLSMNYDFVIHTPLMWINKEQTWELADKLGVFDFVKNKTLTCYNGIIGDGCGECPACKLRKDGLQKYLDRR